MRRSYQSRTKLTCGQKRERSAHWRKVRQKCGDAHCLERLSLSIVFVPTGSPSRGGDVTVYVLGISQPSFPHLLRCFCVYLGLYGPFNCISFHKSSRQLSAFSLCSSSLICALLVLSTIYVFLKVSFSPDIIHSGWLGSKHQWTN